MARATLGANLIPGMEEISAVLAKHDPIMQQQLLEILTVRHALRMGNKGQAQFVADSMHKHINSIMNQYWEGEAMFDDGQHRGDTLRP